MSHSTFTRIKKMGHTCCSNITLSKLAKHLFLDYEKMKKGNVVELEPEALEYAKITTPPPVPVLDPVEKSIIERLNGMNFEGKWKVLTYINDIRDKHLNK